MPHRHEICQKKFMTRFSGRKVYKLNVRKLWLLLLRMKQCKCIKINKLSHFLLILCKITLIAYKYFTSTQILQENALYSGKIYTAGTIFTRPPVVTVATNLNSEGRENSRCDVINSFCWWLHHDTCLFQIGCDPVNLVKIEKWADIHCPMDKRERERYLKLTWQSLEIS